MRAARLSLNLFASILSESLLALNTPGYGSSAAEKPVIFGLYAPAPLLLKWLESRARPPPLVLPPGTTTGAI